MSQYNYFLLTLRVVKVNTGSKEKFAPRTTNRESWRVSGPWRRRSAAEHAAQSALSTHTCLSAQVVTIEQLESLRGSTDYMLVNAAIAAIKLAAADPRSGDLATITNRVKDLLAGLTDEQRAELYGALPGVEHKA